jgi:hypothetical protein
MNEFRGRQRAGFTVLETVAALGILAVVAVLVAQLGFWSLAERARAEEQFAAVESTANVLEAARARPWAELTPEWAAAQRLPEDVAIRMEDGVLTVRVEPEPDRPRVKRISVELRWHQREGLPSRSVTTMGLFADRSEGGVP